MEAWGVFQRYDYMNVIDSTWLFNLKQFSEGLKNKLKPVLSLYLSAVGRSEFFFNVQSHCAVENHLAYDNIRSAVGYQIQARRCY